jgi:hypothetical protein
MISGHIFFQKKTSSKAFKMNFWSTDDAPLIRPILKPELSKSPKSQQPTATMLSMSSRTLDGYGGIACERITTISGRTGRQWLAGYATIILGASAVFALLLKFKDNSKLKK